MHCSSRLSLYIIHDELISNCRVSRQCWDVDALPKCWGLLKMAWCFLLVVLQRSALTFLPFLPLGTLFRELLESLVELAFIFNMHLSLCCQISQLTISWAHFLSVQIFLVKIIWSTAYRALSPQFISSHAQNEHRNYKHLKGAFIKCWVQAGHHSIYNHM